MVAPARAAAAAVAAFSVSTLTTNPRPASSVITGITRACSSAGATRVRPGPRRLAADVDHVRTLGAEGDRVPDRRIRRLAHWPPSLKESGVTLSTPMISVTRWRRSGR